MGEKIIKSFKEIGNMSDNERKKYYDQLFEICKSRNKKLGLRLIAFKFIALISPIQRSFPYEIRGVENIPKENALFVCNHSNTHDTFTAIEVLNRLKRPLTTLVAWDGLSALSRTAFWMGNCTFMDRSDADSKEKGILDLCSKMIHGQNGLIFGEATWNLHPILPMQGIKAGIAMVAIVTGKPIVPVTFEYVEVPTVCKKEAELITKCIVTFGKPVYVNAQDNVFDATNSVCDELAAMRKRNWEELGIKRDGIEDINQEVYLNHLYLKKFKAFGFKYVSEYESQYLLKKNGTVENEFHLDDEGRFCPGILVE